MEDNDLAASIKTLELSTLAIDQQCAMLEAQLEAMKELRKLNDPPSLPSDTVSGIAKHSRQRQTINTETEKLSDTLNGRVTSLRKQTETDMTSLEAVATRQLEKDDRLLDGLQSLMSSIELPGPANTETAEIHKLCQALRSLQASVVKGRANRTFLAALQQAHDRLAGKDVEARPDEDIEISTLSAELDSLIDEVDSVLEMTVTSRYQHPILLTLNVKQRENERQRQHWLLYVETALQQMTGHLRNLSAHAQELRGFGSALGLASAMLEKSAIPTPPVKPVRPIVASRLTDKSLRHLVLPTSAPIQPASEFLRHHAIQTPAARETKPEALEAALESASSTRKSRLAGLAQSTDESLAAQIASSLDLADTQLQTLLNAVHAYSPYGSINLTDKEMKQRLAQLDKGIEGLGDRLRGIDLQAMTDRERELVAAVLDTEGKV